VQWSLKDCGITMRTRNNYEFKVKGQRLYVDTEEAEAIMESLSHKTKKANKPHAGEGK